MVLVVVVVMMMMVVVLVLVLVVLVIMIAKSHMETNRRHTLFTLYTGGVGINAVLFSEVTFSDDIDDFSRVWRGRCKLKQSHHTALTEGSGVE